MRSARDDVRDHIVLRKNDPEMRDDTSEYQLQFTGPF
jgi:hypothetical protein